jgi:hypothetical protein
VAITCTAKLIQPHRSKYIPDLQDGGPHDAYQSISITCGLERDGLNRNIGLVPPRP